MEGEELDRYRRLLRERRQQLIDEGDVPIERARKDDSRIGGDEDEQPLTEMNQVLASNRNRARAAELRLIEGAMTRLEAEPDLYGLCEVCEEPIPTARLSTMPHARMCVGCQSSREAPARKGARRNLTDFI